MLTLPTGPIQLLSIAYFTKMPMAITKMAIPILLIKFSPMNFSKSGFFSKKLCLRSTMVVGFAKVVVVALGAVNAAIDSTSISFFCSSILLFSPTTAKPDFQ